MKKLTVFLILMLMLVFFSTASAFHLKWFYAQAPADSIGIGLGYDRMIYGSSAALINLPDVNSIGGEADEWLEIVIGSDELCNPEDADDSSNGVWRCIDAQGNLEWYRGTGTDESRSSPAVLDFYGDDGLPDIIAGTTSGWNIEAMDRFGAFLWTFPAPPVLSGPFAWHSSPAVADIVPDISGLEVVIGCNADWDATAYYGMWCLQTDPSDGIDEGISHPGWLAYPEPPGGIDGIDWDVIWYYPTDCPVISTPCLVDMNDDYHLDVVFGVGWSDWVTGSDNGKIICLDGSDGSLLWEFSTGSNGVSASPSAADFDSDGDFEIVIGAYNGSLYFIDGDEDGSGAIESAEYHEYAHSGKILSSTAIGDIDGDGEYEVVAGIGAANLKIFDYTPASGPSLSWWIDLGDTIISSPALAGDPDDPAPWPFFRHDILRTGFYPSTGHVLDIFVAVRSGANGILYSIDGGSGTITDSVRVGTKVHTSPVIADIDGDCVLDLVITGSNLHFDAIWESEGPDTIFCFGTGITIHGCEDEEFHPHISDIFTEDCSLRYATVCVFNEDTEYVRGLTMSNFIFVENGWPIMPSRLELLNECPPETARVDVVLLFDFSTSMDEEVGMLDLHVPEFIGALADIDYQIALWVFNGCEEEFDGVELLVQTNFSGPCTYNPSGPDWWASNPTDFSCLFDALVDDLYTWIPAERGSGYEDQYGAIVRANEELDFRPDAQKVFVLFTDERPIVNGYYCMPIWGETPDSFYQYPPDSIIQYCLEESIIVIPVTPHDGEFEWWTGGETSIREYYEGYYELGPATGGDWFYLYSSDYSELVTAIGEEISEDSCCYQFVWVESLFCVDSIHLEVTAFDGAAGIFGTDDTIYDALCAPQLELSMPIPCGGITTCAGQGFVYTYVNNDDGALVESTLVMTVGDSTITAADSGVVVSAGGISYFPPYVWNHGDTIAFWIDYIENEFGCASFTEPCTFIVDIVAPEVILTTPAPGETLFSLASVTVSARLFDDFSGVDTSIFSEENVYVVRGLDTVFYDSLYLLDSLRFVLDGLALPGDGHYSVCVRNLDDSPDYIYCPPNHLAQWCWDFYVISIERNVWFGDTTTYPCDTAYIPLYIDSLSNAIYNSLDVWFHCDFELLHPVRLDIAGVAAPIGFQLLEEIIPDTLWHIRIEWSPPVLDADGGIVVWMLALTSCNACGGDFTSIIIDSALINSGYPQVLWSNGFFYSQWRIEPWLHDIYIHKMDGSEWEVLSIGANTSATEEYDAAYDLIYIEPTPTDVDAYICLQDTEHPAITKLKRSMKALEPPRYWTIKTDSETLAVVHWNPYNFPDGQVELNGLIDMKIDTFYLWRPSEVESLVIEWYLPELRQHNSPLLTGWNMISLPYIPTHHSPADVFPHAIGAWGYNTSTSSYYTAVEFERGVGYWLYSFSDTNYILAGTPVTDYSRLCTSGWNLIGTTVEPHGVGDATTSPPGMIMPPFYKYGGTSYVPESDTLFPGMGYWILLLGNAVLSLPGDGTLLRAVSTQPPEWLADALFEFGENEECLHFGISKDASEQLDASDIVFPPATPLGQKFHRAQFRREIFEINTDISSEADWWLEVDSTAVVTISLPNEIELVIVKSNGDMFELCGERELSLEAGAYRICSPDKAKVPELALLPNYPNPFNASTLVRFSTPKRERVRLSVVDMLGRRTSVLLDEKVEPGFHSVRWNPTGAPSGIYFIRLITPSGQRTMRTMLVK